MSLHAKYGTDRSRGVGTVASKICHFVWLCVLIYALNKIMCGPYLPQYCFNCTKFGKLILRKIINTVATRCHRFRGPTAKRREGERTGEKGKSGGREEKVKGRTIPALFPPL